MKLSENSIILTKLNIVANGNKYVIGKQYSNDYFSIPEDGKRILELTNSKSISIIEIAEKTKLSVKVIIMFLEQILSLGLIWKIDGIEQYDESPHKTSKLKNMANVVFSKYFALIVLCIMIVIMVFTFWIKHNAVKNNILASNTYPGFNLLYASCLGFLVTAFHEIGHYLAAAKYDIPVKFNLSTRLGSLVIEAKMNSIWGLQKKQRYIPLVGGMYFDIIFLSLLTLAINFHGFVGATGQVCFNLIVTEFLFQLAIFLRTDLYFIILNFLGVDGLQNKVVEVLKGKNKELYPVVYTILAIIGTLCFLIYFAFLAFNSITAEFYLFYRNIFSSNLLMKVDSIVGILIILAIITMTIFTFIKEKLLRNQ